MKRFLITVRPWRASGGSSVHDEAVSYHARSAYEALMKLYQENYYDFTDFRVIDIQEQERESR